MTSPTLRGDPVPADPPRLSATSTPAPSPEGSTSTPRGPRGMVSVIDSKDGMAGPARLRLPMQPFGQRLEEWSSSGGVFPFDSGLVDVGPGGCWGSPSPRGTLERSSPGRPCWVFAAVAIPTVLRGAPLKTRKIHGSEDASDRSKPEDDLPVRGLPTIQPPGLSLLHLHRDSGRRYAGGSDLAKLASCWRALGRLGPPSAVSGTRFVDVVYAGKASRGALPPRFESVRGSNGSNVGFPCVKGEGPSTPKVCDSIDDPESVPGLLIHA
ncbi:hypothetical protein THAOC_35687, partial [Thalassiosira oceanica]